MQTFLPHPDFEGSAASLDDRRLGKQRVGRAICDERFPDVPADLPYVWPTAA